MKTIFLTVVLVSVAFVSVSLMMTPYLLQAEGQTDLLPLGPSKYKFLIDKVEKDKIVQTASNTSVSIADILEQTKNTDVYIIGEAHDNFQCHAFQRDFIDALFQKNPKVIVGFEFFWREDNNALEEFRNGSINEDELLKKTGWYDRGNMNFALTRLIMDVIKKNKIKTIGLNIPRSLVRTVSRSGFNALKDEEKKLFPTINVPNTEHQFFIKGIFGDIAVQMPDWFTKFYDAQKCWDVIMAESMREMLAKKEYKGYKGVIIAGNNHVVYKLGIPFRYGLASKRTRLTTISPVLLPKPIEQNNEDDDGHPMMAGMGGSQTPSVIYSRGMADYVFAAEQPKDYHFPVLGISVDVKEKKLMVTRVSKKSIADKYGIRKGDQIISFDGINVETAGQFRMLAAQKNWNDSINVGLIKNVLIKKDEAPKEITGKDPKEGKEGKDGMAPKQPKEGMEGMKGMPAMKDMKGNHPMKKEPKKETAGEEKKKSMDLEE